MYFWSWLPSSPKGEIVGNIFLVSYYIELIVLDGKSLTKDIDNDSMKNSENHQQFYTSRLTFSNIEQFIRGFVKAKSRMSADKYDPSRVWLFVLQIYKTRGHYHGIGPRY